MNSGGRGRLPFARKARGDSEAGEPYLTARRVHQNIGRLDVLVDEAVLVHLAKGRGNADGDAQETSHLHRRAEQPAEQLAAGILEHQNGLTAISHKFKRSHRPRAVQLILEGVFVGKAIEGGRCRLLRGWEHDQHAITPAFCAVTPPSAEGESTILRQDLEGHQFRSR